MNKLSNFFFYLGLFTINAFRYNWKAIVLTTLGVGAVSSLATRSAWHFIPVFIGVYIGALYVEYKQFKRHNNEH